jgi:hypothetical protein
MYVIESRPESSMPTRKPTADDFEQFREALENETPETLGVSRATYFRWKAGDLPEFATALLARPHLVRVLQRDANLFYARTQPDE